MCLGTGDKSSCRCRCWGDRTQVPKGRSTRTGWIRETDMEQGGQEMGEEAQLGVCRPAAHGTPSNGGRGQCPSQHVKAWGPEAWEGTRGFLTLETWGSLKSGHSQQDSPHL